MQGRDAKIFPGPGRSSILGDAPAVVQEEKNQYIVSHL